MTIDAAVGELVRAAFQLHGGERDRAAGDFEVKEK